MAWLNEPATWMKTDDRVLARARPKTDFWRTTFYGYVTVNGHFFNLPVSGDFAFEAHVAGFDATFDSLSNRLFARRRGLSPRRSAATLPRLV